MTKKEKAVVIGSILGDGFLQKTGKNNARLRLEHSLKQQSYLLWKVQMLKNYFQHKPQILTRTNPKFLKTYQYIRAQSYSGLEFGKLLKIFYKDNQKIIPDLADKLLSGPLCLAVWYMDDGYYYPRDKIAYLYLPKYDQTSINNLLNALELNFNLFPNLKIKKRGEYVLNFPVLETSKLLKIVKPYIISEMEYKLGKIPFDPVSTEPKKETTDIVSG